MASTLPARAAYANGASSLKSTAATSPPLARIVLSMSLASCTDTKADTAAARCKSDCLRTRGGAKQLPELVEAMLPNKLASVSPSPSSTASTSEWSQSPSASAAFADASPLRQPRASKSLAISTLPASSAMSRAVFPCESTDASKLANSFRDSAASQRARATCAAPWAAATCRGVESRGSRASSDAEHSRTSTCTTASHLEHPRAPSSCRGV
mmetsp:Transcript_61361/g.146176  ORF Transcript_61361/g.146176 Transcript_61361/m.146176 type:complete len:212 (-) Transcript_61361:307-942(-)